MNARCSRIARSGTLALLACCTVAASTGCRQILWQPSISTAQRQAASDGRLVLVYYWSLFNNDCARMDRTVFKSKEVTDTMAGTIPVRLDAGLHKAWAREHGIHRIPSFAIFGPDGRLISLRQGAMSDSQFRGFVVSGKLNR